jgi:hypothetical protein
MAALEIEHRVVRMERENADKQRRILRAVRDLDHVAYSLTSTSSPESIRLREFVLEAQDRLRGTR